MCLLNLNTLTTVVSSGQFEAGRYNVFSDHAELLLLHTYITVNTVVRWTEYSKYVTGRCGLCFAEINVCLYQSSPNSDLSHTHAHTLRLPLTFIHWHLNKFALGVTGNICICKENPKWRLSFTQKSKIVKEFWQYKGDLWAFFFSPQSTKYNKPWQMSSNWQPSVSKANLVYTAVYLTRKWQLYECYVELRGCCWSAVHNKYRDFLVLSDPYFPIAPWTVSGISQVSEPDGVWVCVSDCVRVHGCVFLRGIEQVCLLHAPHSIQ